MKEFDNKMAESERVILTPSELEDLDNPGVDENRKREIYRKLGAILVLIAGPLMAILLIRKIIERISQRRVASKDKLR